MPYHAIMPDSPGLEDRLKKAGFKEGTVQELFNLSDEDMEYIEFRLALTKLARQRRKELKMSQEVLAKRIKSSQSRVAKMENGDTGISTDFILNALFALGLTRKEVCEAASG